MSALTASFINALNNPIQVRLDPLQHHPPFASLALLLRVVDTSSSRSHIFAHVPWVSLTRRQLSESHASRQLRLFHPARNTCQIIFCIAMLALVLHLRQEIQTLKQEQSSTAVLNTVQKIFQTLLEDRDEARAKVSSITALNEKLTHERDAARVETSTVKRRLNVKERAEVLHSKRVTPKNGACRLCPSPTDLPLTHGPKNDLISQVPAAISACINSLSSSSHAPLVPSALPATTTKTTINQVALAAEAHQGPISRRVLVAGAQPASTTQSPTTFTATCTTKSNTSTINITTAAGATRALIKRALGAISPSTPSPLPRPVATTTTTSVSTLAVKTSPARLTPSRPPRVNSPQSNTPNKPSPLGRSWVTAPSTPSLPHNATPTAVKPVASVSKSTYTPDKATLAAAAILGLISRGSAGKGPLTSSKLPKLDKTPVKTPAATPIRTIMQASRIAANVTPSKIPLPSPDTHERAFFAEEKYFSKLPFPNASRPPPVCRPCDDAVVCAYAQVVKELVILLFFAKCVLHADTA
ncbi:hypothetical protein BJ741DRAFT_628358 [Chytriomyces cf. hyalinus JEL632]|nr:hypothetical protein BJ741DRAFT_628358 [Chytriomyces cf. hyalinus JEL632]